MWKSWCVHFIFLLVVWEFMILLWSFWNICSWFLYRMRDKNCFILLHLDIQFQRCSLFFPQCVFLASLKKSSGGSCMLLYLGHLFYSTDESICYYASTMLLLLLWSYTTASSQVWWHMPQFCVLFINVFGFDQGFLDCQDLLCFHIHVKNNFYPC